MIESVIKRYLDSHLTVPAFLEKPLKSPKNFVLFEKTGSGKTNHIVTVSIAFQSYGKTMYEAAEINEELKQIIEKMVELPEISSVKLNSDYNYTDTETKEYRYQAVYDIAY